MHRKKGVTKSPLSSALCNLPAPSAAAFFQLFDRPQPRRCFGQLRCGNGEVEVALLIAQRSFGLLFCHLCRCRVDVVSAQRRIGKDGHAARLNLEETTRRKEHFFVAVIELQTHRTGLDAGQQRRVARHDAEFAESPSHDHHRDAPRENFLLGADDVAMQRHRHG